MQCPSCGAPQLLPQYRESDGASIDWTAECPIAELIPDAQAWRCGLCGCSLASDQLPIRDEAELSQFVPRVMQGEATDAASDAHALTQLRQQAAFTVGTAHWTWALATFALLQKCLHLLRNSPVVAFSEHDLRLASTAVAEWLDEAAPQSSEQRLSAVFLAAQLAEDLGGGLRRWGYNLHSSPGGGELAFQLAEHGWRLSDDAVWGPERRGSTRAASASEGPARGGGPPSARLFRASWQ